MVHCTVRSERRMLVFRKISENLRQGTNLAISADRTGDLNRSRNREHSISMSQNYGILVLYRGKCSSQGSSNWRG